MQNITPTALSALSDLGDLGGPNAPELLTAAEEAALQHRIEAGVAAEAALAGWLAAPSHVTADELARIAADGERARTHLAGANTGLVWWVVGPIARRSGHSAAELFQEGSIGLLEAIQRFDPDRARFTTYAVPRIRMRAWDAAATSHGSLGIPARRARQWRRVRGVASELTVSLARTPRVAEVARVTGESIAVTQALLAFAPPIPLSPDAQRWDELGPATAQRSVTDEVDRAAVRRLLRRLDDQDRAMMVQLYGLEGPARTYAQVAREQGRSESTVRRRERLALDLLRAGAAARLAA